jgi:hypothetical protein
MKIDNYLLSKEDVENLKIRESVYGDISNKIDIEIDRITNEVSENHGVDIDKLDKIYFKKEKLKLLYDHCSGYEVIMCLVIFLLVATILGITDPTYLLPRNKVIAYLFLPINIWMIVYLAICLVRKYKIKNNLKKYGLN